MLYLGPKFLPITSCLEHSMKGCEQKKSKFTSLVAAILEIHLESSSIVWPDLQFPLKFCTRKLEIAISEYKLNAP